LDTGVGFHADLTGEENMQFASVLQGLTPREARHQAASIIEFAGLRDFMDMPLKHYSSGMRARLSFAIACAVPSEIMVLDEALSVGDVAFRRQGMDRLAQLRARGMTCIFVSHWLWGLQHNTEEVIWLDHGRIVDRGSPLDVLPRYTGGWGDEIDSGAVQLDSAHAQPDTIDPRQGTTITATLRVLRPDQRADIRLRLMSAQGRVMVESEIENASRLAERSPGAYRLVGHIESFPMAAGTYQLAVAAVDPLDGTVLARAITWITVRGRPSVAPQLSLHSRWEVAPAPDSPAAIPRIR
jgi:ABC-type multidrug transport system ATPase subunit